MPAQIILQQVGPLPIKQTFNAPVDGPVTFFVAGTGRSPSANNWIGVQIFVDDSLIGRLFVFCDQAQIHRSLIPNLISTNLSLGQHTMKLAPMNTNTLTDDNDGFVVTLLY